MADFIRLIKNIKIKLVFIFLSIIFTVGILYLYPSRNNVLRGNQYELFNEEYNEEFSVTINPRTYKLTTTQNNSHIHKKLYDRFDSSLYLENINIIDNKINIYILSATKWKFTKGSCLINTKATVENNYITYEHVFNKPIILDDKGKEVRYAQYGTDGLDSLIITLSSEDFYSHEGITIKFKGYNHLSYVRKVFSSGSTNVIENGNAK